MKRSIVDIVVYGGFCLVGGPQGGAEGADECEVSTAPPQSELDGMKKSTVSTNSYPCVDPR